jgi:beta-galactosidase
MINRTGRWIGVSLLAGTLLFSFLEDAQAARSQHNFNGDWRFMQGQQPQEAASMEFDDTGWEAVRLPHDWAIAGPFNPDEHGYAGKLPWRGVGWYRKTFVLDAADAGKRVYLDFDGVMAFPKVYVNGQLAGQWDYGYAPFRVDATPYVRFGQENIAAVQVDTRKHGTRWYPGAGIYRSVTLTLCESVHLGHWATFVTTPAVGDEAATVQVETVVENHHDESSDVSIEFQIRAPDGRIVAVGSQPCVIAAADSASVEQTFTVANPQRWDITAPHLYTLSVRVYSDQTLIDEQAVSFGIRTFAFTADDGFHLNGRRVQLYGVNLHHDHGPLGAAFYRRAMERQLEIMRDMGVNAIRTSHNPPASDLLDLCDRMGFVVWNEAFDKWDGTAGRHDGQPPLEEFGEKQIRNFVMRDRNHPSVVVWSIGNEISNESPSNKEGKSGPKVAMMRNFVLKYDPTRPVGMGCFIPETANRPILDALDLTGWNYLRRYSIYRQRYPHKPIVYSESASALSTRGFYNVPLAAFKTDYSDQRQVCSYDLNAAPWADIPDVEFALMEKDRFVAGEFVWTGFDYLGEPTPFDQEARSSYFGIVDLCGIPKDRFYLYRSYWRPEATTVHILPHWNWPDRIGKNVPVFVYTNGDEAELFLNGKSLGRRIKGQRPARPENYASGAAVSVSSEQENNPAKAMLDGDSGTRWCASSGAVEQWIQLDLGQVVPIQCLTLEFEREAKYYGYSIGVSKDGQNWTQVVSKAASDQPRRYGPKEVFHSVNIEGRYLRMEFNELRGGSWASICRFGAYPQEVESDYYAPTYDYRLRWNDVVYEPGELKAAAYKNGRKIGEAIMRTAGKPAQIRLTPDRGELKASGEDLSYILVEALDEQGTVCPLADALIHFEIDGPAEIAGVGNGNPLSLEPFQADYRKLFFGKAMLILRSREGQTGSVQIRAHGQDLRDGKVTIKVSK